MFSLVRYSVMVSAQTLSFRKEMLTKYVIMGDYVTRDIEKSSLSVLSWLILERICELFLGTNETVRYMRVSVELVSTV